MTTGNNPLGRWGLSRSVSSDGRRSRSHISQSHSTPNFGKGGTSDSLKPNKTLLKGDYMPKELQNWENRSSSWKSRQLKLAFLNKKQNNRVSRINSAEPTISEFSSSTKSFDRGDFLTRSLVAYSQNSRSSVFETTKSISKEAEEYPPRSTPLFSKEIPSSYAHRERTNTVNGAPTCQFFDQHNNFSTVPKSKSLHSIKNKDDHFHFSSFATRFSVARETDL